jgi:hypothetical protein
MRKNKTMLEDRFSDHPNPVLYGVVGALFSDSPTGCALLGQRNTTQVDIAATLGECLANEDTEWIKNLYSSYKY